MSRKNLNKTKETTLIRTRLEPTIFKKLDKLTKQYYRSRFNYAGWILRNHMEKEFNSPLLKSRGFLENW